MLDLENYIIDNMKYYETRSIVVLIQFYNTHIYTYTYTHTACSFIRIDLIYYVSNACILLSEVEQIALSFTFQTQ